MLLMFLEGNSPDCWSLRRKRTPRSAPVDMRRNSVLHVLRAEPLHVRLPHARVNRTDFVRPTPAGLRPESNGKGSDARDHARQGLSGSECPCSGFKPNELSFDIAQPFAFDRGRDDRSRSSP